MTLSNDQSTPQGWPDGLALRVYDEIDSTNAEAARLAPELAGPAWVLALRQTAGRGRRGRAWSDGAGNFMATHVSHPQTPAGDLSLRSFAAALALHDALIALGVQAEALGLKWPNDVLLNGGKLAGILLESAGQGGATRPADHLCVGIGVNLTQAPKPEPGAAFAPVALADETGITVSPRDFLGVLAPAYAARIATLRDQGFAPIRAAWLARAARRGETLTARLPGQEITGRFEDLDAQGNLILQTPRGRESVASADVTFGGPHASGN